MLNHFNDKRVPLIGAQIADREMPQFSYIVRLFIGIQKKKRAAKPCDLRGDSNYNNYHNKGAFSSVTQMYGN